VDDEERSGPPYRDYLRPELRGAGIPPAPALVAPRPGRGTVFATLAGVDSVATWQDGPDECVDVHGDAETVLAWARSRPAARRLLFSEEAGDYLPLDA
jgi:hypothetical protein